MTSCTANLKQWGLILTTLAEDNNGKLMAGTNANGWWWPWQLPNELKDWKQNKIWLCPTATKPLLDGIGNQIGEFTINSALVFHLISRDEFHHGSRAWPARASPPVGNFTLPRRYLFLSI